MFDTIIPDLSPTLSTNKAEVKGYCGGAIVAAPKVHIGEADLRADLYDARIPGVYIEVEAGLGSAAHFGKEQAIDFLRSFARVAGIAFDMSIDVSIASGGVEVEGGTTFVNLTSAEVAAFVPQGDCEAADGCVCGAMDDSYICTLDSGHDGPHEAWGVVNLWHVWKEV